MKGLNDLMQQAQQMQERMQKMQEEAANAEVEGQSGAGMVKVVMTGRHDVRKIDIDPGLLPEGLSPEDREMLEDLLAAAISDAVRKVEISNQQKMGEVTAGMQMPTGFKMPF